MSDDFVFPDMNEVVKKEKFFALVLDGELVHLHSVPLQLEAIVAIFSSDPKVVPLTSEQALSVHPGFLYDGENFTAPSGD